MVKKTAKNRINTILSQSTKGLFSDDSWIPVNNTWKALREAGFEVDVQSTRYGQDDKGNPKEKVWLITVSGHGFSFPGILTAHGAGTVADPLSMYDISAYVM